MRSAESRIPQDLLQLLLGLTGIAAVTAVYFWLQLPLVSAALTYLILIVVLSFVSSIPLLLALCFVAAACLDYFFTSPMLSFRIDHPQDITGIATFFIAALTVIGLVRRLQAEQNERRDSEERWKTVFEKTPTMYFMLDIDGTVLSVNPFGAEQLGYPADELVGRSVLNVFYEPDREAVQRNATACLEHPGRAMSWELRKVRKDGSMLWVRETARAVPMKGRPVILIVCEDITERKRAEYLTGRVFETYPDGICVIGRDYRLQRVNPVYAQIVGIPAEKLVGAHGADLLGTSFFEQTLRPNYDRCFAGEAISYTEWFDYPRGRRFMAISYSPLRPESERVEAILVITRDLTDHVLASEALRSAQADLAHANRVATMGQLTASIAHEVNQPITAAVTNARAALRWLSAQPPNFEEVEEALARIVNEGGRAGEVIERVRRLIKKAPPQKDAVAINDAILEVMALTRAEAANNRVSVRTQLADGLPLVQGDRVQLQQVILNVTINAIEAMCSVSEENRDLLICTRQAEPDAVLVEVRDSGPGLPPEAVDQLFESFYTTKPTGLGLGLSICRSIIEAHNGQTWASANVPRGAIFHFTVPVQPGGAS
jgi:PAS domain S-box-containing protein